MLWIESLSAATLRAHLHYAPETGVFTRLRQAGNAKPGDRAGARSGAGYLEISVCGQRHRAHRLAWLYMTGRWPRGEVCFYPRPGVRMDVPRWADLFLLPTACAAAQAAQRSPVCRGALRSIAGRAGQMPPPVPPNRLDPRKA